MAHRTETIALSPAIEAARLPPRARENIERTRVMAELHVAQARAETFTALALACATAAGVDEDLTRMIDRALVEHRAALRFVGQLRIELARQR